MGLVCRHVWPTDGDASDCSWVILIILMKPESCMHASGFLLFILLLHHPSPPPLLRSSGTQIHPKSDFHPPIHAFLGWLINLLARGDGRLYICIYVCMYIWPTGVGASEVLVGWNHHCYAKLNDACMHRTHGIPTYLLHHPWIFPFPFQSSIAIIPHTGTPIHSFGIHFSPSQCLLNCHLEVASKSPFLMSKQNDACGIVVSPVGICLGGILKTGLKLNKYIESRAVPCWGVLFPSIACLIHWSIFLRGHPVDCIYVCMYVWSVGDMLAWWLREQCFCRNPVGRQCCYSTLDFLRVSKQNKCYIYCIEPRYNLSVWEGYWWLGWNWMYICAVPCRAEGGCR